MVDEELYFIDGVCFFIIVPDFSENLRKTELVGFDNPRESFGIVGMIDEVPKEDFFLNYF